MTTSTRSFEQARVTVLSGGAPASAASPTRLGRYVIEGILGAGGMAVVYLARDPVLDRAVALKVLRSDDETGAARLVREGQALARVSHPSVIHVYEVGRETDGLIYIAMERIVGVTLAAWLGAPRTQREIIDVFLAAGRGLAAAHAAGLVHRDFKPENAMVGDDGRVSVLDFGLARPSDDVGEPRAARTDGGALTATAAGSVVGTPAYMSPEQWRGERATAASDQFSFCVALWRAVTGEHPFALGSRDALRSSVVAGAAKRLPRTVPRRLRAVLRRGVAVDPAARFSSIDALLTALCARPRWHRFALPAITAGVVVAAVLGLAPASDTARTTLYTAPVAITSRGDIAASAVSPDGRNIALITRDAVIVQPLQPGAEQRVVLRGRLVPHALSWSPDGTQLAFVAAIADGTLRPGLLLVELASGQVRRLGDDTGAIALLGGDEIASAGFFARELRFTSYGEPARPRRRCPLPGQFTGIRSLSFDAARDAVHVQLDDTDRRSTVLRVDRQCRIATVADALPILSFVMRASDHRLLMREMWGSHHLVEIGDDAASRLGQHVIQSNDYAPLAVLGDGRIAHRDSSTRWALHAITADGARVELARGGAESRFSLSADGRIAQIDDLYGRGVLRVTHRAPGSASLAPFGALDGATAPIATRAVRGVWSPDGQRLAILLQTSEGYRLTAWRVDTGAMSPSYLLPTPYDVELTWLDDDRVAYPVLNERAEHRWIHLATGASGRLALGVGRPILSLVRAHGDRRLAFVTSEPSGATVWTLTEGSTPQPLATIPLAAPRWAGSLRVTWAADDRSLVLYEARSRELWSIAGGTVARLPAAEARSGELTVLSDVFPLADRIVVASVVTSADVYVSAPIAE